MFLLSLEIEKKNLMKKSWNFLSLEKGFFFLHSLLNQVVIWAVFWQ